MKSYQMLMTIFLSYSLVSCKLTPPNIELCGKLSNGAHCNYTLEDNPRNITENEWDEIGRVSMSLDDFGKLKVFILEACKRSKKCDKKEMEFINDTIR